MADDRTEKATPHRRQEARRQGQVVHSRELTGSLVLLTGTLFLGWFTGVFILRWRNALFVAVERGIAGDLSLAAGGQAISLLQSLIVSTLLPVALMMGGLFCVAALAAVAQSGGFVVREDALTPQFERLSPANYAEQVFSFTGITRMLKSLAPTLLLVYLAYRLLSAEFLSTPVMSLARLPQMYHQAYLLLLETSFIMLGWSGLDYVVEWRALEQRLRMSKQEVRDDMKQTEGSPQVRRRIRSIQRQMRRRRIKADVSRASVVITNPTHYAVALEFHLETMQAPKVLTKGRNLFAEQIKDEARWAGVPIVENPPLARSLYRSVDAGQSIPYDLYTVVAEILAFLYRSELERKASQRHTAEGGGGVRNGAGRPFERDIHEGTNQEARYGMSVDAPNQADGRPESPAVAGVGPAAQTVALSAGEGGRAEAAGEPPAEQESEPRS
jgi:flagellar biosynthetic protein FlhB